MPIYEYRCRDCGRITEILEGAGVKKEPLCCRYCGGAAMARIFSSFFVSRGDQPAGPAECACSREEGKVKERSPKDVGGNWPANDDYLRLAID